MMHATFFLATLAALNVVMAFTALPIEINSPPSIIYWGCDYPVLLSGGDGTDATIDLVNSSGRLVSHLFQDIEIGPLNEFVPYPSIAPAGVDLYLQAQDSHTIAISNKFRVVAKEGVPSDCDAPRAASTMTFPVPSTSATSQTSSTSASATSATTTLSSSTASPRLSSTFSSSSRASISSTSSTTMTMAVSVPTATPTTSGGALNEVSCPDIDPRVSAEWQCQPGSICITLDDASSAICCNDHVANCTTIFALDCDIQQQNATAHPQSPIFTTWLDAALPSCGQQCCPVGYYCHHSANEVDWHCLMATSKSSINFTAEELVRKPKASTPPAANGTATDMFMPAAIATLLPGDATQSDSTGGNGTSNNRPLSGGSVAGIAVGGCAALALIGAAVFWIIRRRKKQHKGDSDDLDIKPYEFTAPQAGGSAGGTAGGGAFNSRFSEAGMSDGTGYHVEKDGHPIQSPSLSPMVEKDGQPILSREQSPRRGPNGTVYEMA